MSLRKSLSRLAVAIMLISVAAVNVSMVGAAEADVRNKAAADAKNGNWKDAYQGFRSLCLDEKSDSRAVSNDLAQAVMCLNALGLIKDIDELIESSVKAHAGNWRLFQMAASQYMDTQHQGFMISGVYERGPHRGGGKVMQSWERDRVRALQLMQLAMPIAVKDDNKADVSQFFLVLSNHLLYNRGFYESWRLQYLTNLAELPDYDEGYYYYRNASRAPVDAEGNPVFHSAPKDWETAATDGERWRWCLEQIVEFNPQQLNYVRWTRAEFLWQQFGVQTMNEGFSPFFRGLPTEDDGAENKSGTYELHTLKETETITKLATGIKRLELPDEHNFIKLYQTIAAEPKLGHAEDSLNKLAQIFEDRRQYPKAAEYWQQSIDTYGPGNENWKRKRLDQIVKNWGQFEGVSTQPSGEGATVEFRFRNAKQVEFKAQAINVAKLLEDAKAYLKGDPGRIDWQQINIADVGYRLVTQNQAQYLVEGDVASWQLDLKPRFNHWDERITVTTPLQKPGAYLVTANVRDGNICKIILWVADTAIVSKQLSGKSLYYVADAVTGKPIERCNLEFFGYKVEGLGGNKFRVLTTNFAERTDADGQVVPDPRDLKVDHQWVITARGDEDRFAYLGFTGVWNGNYYDQEYNMTKVFTITDRPVYRPEQTVNFKIWVRRAQYDQEDVSDFANQSFPIEIYNPKNEKVYAETLQADEYGGLVGKLDIKADATLGQYRIQIQKQVDPRTIVSGGNTFRVEEYKKPEYEVTVEAPTEPVMLGEKITAKINAKYYFGSPVTHAKVKYTISRSEHVDNWFPIMPWDWCYGPGYWWFCYDYPWYPGWDKWAGCRMPAPWWWFRGQPNPPEIVAEREMEIGEDGTINVEIDTAIAKELHGNQDHKYSITAEVVDQSRRTIVGVGDVLVARKPFKVFSWLHRGYYRVGDTVQANFKAQTLDKKPVEGKGVLTLLKITYDKDNQPVETPVRRWDVDTNVEGVAQQQIVASAKGQYRVSYELTDAKEHKIEGGYLFTIIGDGFDGKDYRFNTVELIPEKAEYAPGDTVKLQINTDRVDSTVLLFVRPANGVYLPPKTIRIAGKSAVEEITVVKKDMPNFFVEAVTVSGGQVHNQAKEIVVPPEKRILNVEVLPSETAYLPGQKAKIQIRLTDHTGENFEGQTALTIYDKSVEYISGGSNVPDIKDFFWKWRRHHNPNEQSSLARYFHNLTLPNHDAMSFIGVFGASVVEELAAVEKGQAENRRRDGRGEMLAKGMANAAPGAPQAAFGRAAAGGAAFGGESLREFQSDKASDAKAAGDAEAGGGAGGGPVVQPTVRSNFADTALWKGTLMTNKNGVAEVELDMPENLTTWKIKVWGMGHGTKVGAGEAEVVTRKNIIVRLQAPRFFVQKDEVVLSTVVHNYLKEAKKAQVVLELEGGTLGQLDAKETPKGTVELSQDVEIPAGGETRVDWRVKVFEEGTATVRMKALTDAESDAMEMKFPCYVHGMLKTESWAGTVRPEQDNAKVSINVPAERRVEQSVLEVRYSPTLAGAMVDALPYLAEYPYGCTEQTLNRFLPSVITQKVLLDMGLDLAAIKEKRTNLNAQEIGDDVERAKQWKRYDRNPVFDQAELDSIVKDGVKQLTNMQNGDGGWGWFSGFGERSWPHTTAVVVHGLQVARHNDVALVPGVLERGIEWLKRYQAEETVKIRNAANKIRPYKPSADDLDAMVYMILIDADQDNEEMRGYLYRDRNNLAVYSKAMFGLALHKLKDEEKLTMILSNIEQYLVQDAENESAYLRLPAENYWWYWYGSETEANAYYLKLLSKTDAKGVTAPRLVKYLLNNRKHATYWRSTRDTAVAVEAFADYIRASGEDKPDMFVEVWVDGQKKKEVEISGENLFSFDNKFVLTGADVADGKHDIEIRRRGKGPVYFNAYLTNFTLEDHITNAGLEVKVTRKFYKLTPVDKEIKVTGSRGQALDQKVQKYERSELADLATLKSGDLVEVELSIESKNDYEYVIFEDMKAAGFEAVEVRSGYTNNGLNAYTEFRDNRVSFFVRQLARGNHSMSYRLRAEIPGKFSALPAHAYAMYAPELKGNSDELKLKIED